MGSIHSWILTSLAVLWTLIALVGVFSMVGMMGGGSMMGGGTWVAMLGLDAVFIYLLITRGRARWTGEART